MVYGSGFHGCEKKSHIVTFFLRKKKEVRILTLKETMLKQFDLSSVFPLSKSRLYFHYPIT